MDDISLKLNPNFVCNNMLQPLSSHICPHLTLDWISFMLKTLLVDFHHEPKALFKNLRKLQQGFREIFFCWDASGSCLARIILAKKQGWPWFPLSYGLMGGGSPVGTRLLQAILFSRKQYEWTDAYLNFSGSQKAAYFVINHTAPDVRKIYPKAKRNTLEWPSETLTCAAGLVLGAVSMQQQGEDQDQNEDESHQSHDQQEPPLLVERTLRQRCR